MQIAKARYKHPRFAQLALRILSPYPALSRKPQSSATHAHLYSDKKQGTVPEFSYPTAVVACFLYIEAQVWITQLRGERRAESAAA